MVAGHAHGGEEEDAGVHVHGGDRAHDLAHDPAKGPAEVQQGVHSPEGQGEDELEVCQRQAHHEAVDRRVVLATAARVEQEQSQEVTHKPQDTHHQVHQGDDNSYLTNTYNHFYYGSHKVHTRKLNQKQHASSQHFLSIARIIFVTVSVHAIKLKVCYF